jgi:hypothetical protein
VSRIVDLVALLDVDNTLLDNDLVLARLHQELAGVLSERLARRFWRIYEQVRRETDLVDFPRTIERFGRVCPEADCMNEVHAILYDFPFRDCLFPDALKVIRHLETFAVPIILSDGDQFFQRRKIQTTGLQEAVGGRVLIYVHKQENIPDIERRYPARHYALVDDKPRIQAVTKQEMGEKLTTVMVMQGKYAGEITQRQRRSIDVMLEGIGDLLKMSKQDLMSSRTAVARAKREAKDASEDNPHLLDRR